MSNIYEFEAVNRGLSKYPCGIISGILALVYAVDIRNRMGFSFVQSFYILLAVYIINIIIIKKATRLLINITLGKTTIKIEGNRCTIYKRDKANVVYLNKMSIKDIEHYEADLYGMNVSLLMLYSKNMQIEFYIKGNRKLIGLSEIYATER